MLQFVTSEKYLKSQKEIYELRREIEEVRNLAYQVLEQNEKIKNSRIDSNALSKEDVKLLINLCHPDKHSGKKIATTMTAKLLKLNL